MSTLRGGTSMPLTHGAAQRLWLLERGEAAAPPDDQQVCRFVGAVAVLEETAVYVVFVMSPESQRASELALQAGGVRLNVERDGFRFATLDEAIEWTNAKRDFWIGHGWTEAAPDADDQ